MAVGLGGGCGFDRVPVAPDIADRPRSIRARPLATSPAPVARRSADSAFGLRRPSIARQIGHTQHSALPVDQPPR
ncbi:hypothetical protein [Actinoplanes sp. NPDC026623]|uniref:hypothetical protein n=1 Tax=Actinoplanes sp. NPDC026623 TaxID=3155610 RepID=UPI0033F8E84C